MEARKQPKEVIEQTYQVLKKSQNDPTIDRALGAIYGAMIGDSIGAYCEFNSSLMDETVNEGT